MAFLEDFGDLLNDTVVYRPVTGRDEFGKPTFGAPVSYQTRVVESIRRVTSRITGDDAISGTQIWIEPISNLNIDDEFTLPDGRKPSLITWSVFPDDNGPHHCKLYF